MASECKHDRLVKVIQKQSVGILFFLMHESYHYEYYQCVKCGKEFIDI